MWRAAVSGQYIHAFAHWPEIYAVSLVIIRTIALFYVSVLFLYPSLCLSPDVIVMLLEQLGNRCLPLVQSPPVALGLD